MVEFHVGIGDLGAELGYRPILDRFVQRASHEFVSMFPVPVDTVDLGVVGFYHHHRNTTLPIVPYEHLFAVGRCKYVFVLSIPLDLRSRYSPSADPHEGFIPSSQIPSSDSSVHAHRRHEVWIPRMPIDVGDSSCVSIYLPIKAFLCRQVPYQEFL